MAIIYLFSIVFAFIALYVYLTRNFNYWKHRNVPFQPPTLLVGNMTFALKESMAVYMHRLYKKFEGHDYFGIWMFDTPVLVIRSPEMAKEILVTKFNSFIDRATKTHESDTLGSKCLFVVKGEHWTRLRQGLSPAFTRAKIRAILATRMPSISKEFCELIDKKHIGKPIDLKYLFIQYLVEVIAGTIFGIRANSLQDNQAPLLKMGISAANWTLFRGLEVMSIFLFPNLVKLFKFTCFGKENNQFLRSLFLKILAMREIEKPDLKAQSHDVVDTLIKLKDSDSVYDFSEDDILAQAAVFFFAGYETTSQALTFMCYELAFDQEYQESIFKEIKTLKMNKTEPDFEELDGLKLLDMGIKETLRKYPVLPFADRLCGEDCELSDGLVVEKGIRVLICTIGLHKDEKYFSEPDRWNPYRFEKEKEMVPYTYMPFSEGQRICIGAKYAMLSMKMTLSTLIERYRFVPCADTIPPKDFRMCPYSVVTASEKPIMLNIVHR